jgi:hypothetical protein
MIRSAMLFLVLAACSSIRVVTATKTGGELALIGDREDAMEKARAEMAKTCGGATSYEIVEEAENAEKGEWRVTYTCKGAPAPATPAPVPTKPAATVVHTVVVVL